ARALGEGGPPAVVLCPSGRWESKRWPAERWAELACALWEGEPRFRPVLLAGAAEAAEAERIALFVKDRAPLEAWVARTKFWETASILARAAAVVGVDSFPLHFAWALGTPTVGLFGPSTPARVGPRGERHAVIWKEDLPCKGCWRHRCPRAEWLCMPGISSADVLRKIGSVLSLTLFS
ncbi:MAG: glycosyltransferase family 9 protein, partial [Planctomycetota bacterium]